MISVVHERLSKFITCYVRALMCGSLGASPTHPAANPALQSSPQVYDYPTNCSWLWWLHTIRSPCMQWWDRQ